MGQSVRTDIFKVEIGVGTGVKNISDEVRSQEVQERRKSGKKKKKSHQT